jgi:hypothetical protein
VRAGDSCNCRSQIKRVSAWVLSLSVDFLGAVSPDTVNRQLSGWALKNCSHAAKSLSLLLESTLYAGAGFRSVLTSVLGPAAPKPTA